MTAKKKISKLNILSAFMDYVLENGRHPNTVFAFSKANDFDEATFYKYFGSFQALEKEVFKAIFDNTLKALLSNEDYEAYGPKEKLLSFYFTFFENLTANRSYVMFSLGNKQNNLNAMKVLKSLKHAFESYIDELDIETLKIEEENIMKAQRAAIRNTAWIQMLLTIKFWMNDESPSFEKTDIFIEKSVNTSFELINTKPLESVVDLGKFLLKETMNIKS
jgi:AcrR family transcriptional regulator